MSPSSGEPLKEFMEENEAIIVNGSSFSSAKQLAARFNQQCNTSKLGRHTSSSEIRLVSNKGDKEEILGDRIHVVVYPLP